MTEVVLLTHANSAGNMHGGELMKIMDSAAGVVAKRHSNRNVVTASVDRLIFKEPILIGNLVLCDAEIIYTGRTSMEIYVTVRVEDLNTGEVKPALEGYFVMVALDRSGKPTNVPPLEIETSEQQQRFEEARQRLERMKERPS
ncbi:MAG: acyl-CoA thioesterase [Firmicutes bacterium]|nr:acyl-CoA thioesterase [Bacillota bacterium]